MADEGRSVSDEAENGLNNAANAGGRAIQKGLPSRPARSPGAGASGGNASPGGNPPAGGDSTPASPAGSDTGNSQGAQSPGTGGSESPAGPGSPSQPPGSQSPGAQPNGGQQAGTQGSPNNGGAGNNMPDANDPAGGSGGTNGAGFSNGNPESAPGMGGPADFASPAPSGSGLEGSTDGGNPDSIGGGQGPENATGGNEGQYPDNYGAGGGGYNAAGGPPEGWDSPGGEGAAGEGALAGAEEAGAGAAGEGAGAAGGAAAGEGAGAAAGAAAAGEGAAAGAAASAGGGAAAGAAVGTAAGPAGTVAGGLIGAVIVPILKFVFMAVAVVVVFISFFMMIPSFLFDNSRATNERDLLEDSYNAYYEHMRNEYKADIGEQIIDAAITTNLLSILPLMRAENGDLSLLYASPASHPYVRMSDEDIAEIDEALYGGRYEEIYFEADTLMLHSTLEYLDGASSNINLVLCLIDTKKDNWFVSLFDGIADTITGGHYSRFTDWVGKKWDGFWNDFIEEELYSITLGWIDEDTETEITDTAGYAAAAIKGEDTSPYEREYLVATITIDYTYDLKDKGVGFYADKMNLSTEEIDRATEMAFYLADLFGTKSDIYFGAYVMGGYHTGAVQGGSVGANLAAGLEKFAAETAGMTFSPDSTPQVFPLSGYSNLPLASAYGPRNFAPDPYHTGIDFSMGPGTAITPVADGIVLALVQSPKTFGNHIIVFHGYHDGAPVATMYAHMSSFGSFEAGDSVSAGDAIGYVGSTGLSTGPHLHFEYLENGERYNPVEKLEVFEYLRPD